MPIDHLPVAPPRFDPRRPLGGFVALMALPSPSARLVVLIVLLRLLGPGQSIVDNRLSAQSIDGAPLTDPGAIAFFETEIRPALVEHCLECHASETELSGGLNLDSQQGWIQGGDLGPAITPGDASSSLLFRAIEYSDPALQMPPDGKLDDSTVAAFRRWIETGAADPRASTGSNAISEAMTGLSVDHAQEHWAYRPLDKNAEYGNGIETADTTEAANRFDRLIDVRLKAAGLSEGPRATKRQLVRRLSFDLTGLPPDPLTAQAFLADKSPQAYDRLVDALLASPAFGEHFARRWMDVVRYAESITLRGFVLPQSWRYRDYLIDAFGHDRPFDQMIRDQIAGDLTPVKDLEESNRRFIATAFLAMGNSNLEDQDKTKLEFDYIDEQLETIGRAFLAQTIGCARCHDHKFDPIPTKDYYALAAIMRSTTSLEHANLSKWIEKNLPLEEPDEKVYRDLEEQIRNIANEIEQLKSVRGSVLDPSAESIAVSSLSGTVIDDDRATFVGDWKRSTSVTPFVGSGYRHDLTDGQGKKTATFEPDSLAPGIYEIRLSYTDHPNRATNTMVTVFSANESKTLRINQRHAPPEEGAWISLGTYPFEKDGQAFVIVSNQDADGCVIVDAVQFRRIGEERPARATDATPEHPAAAASAKAVTEQINKLSERLLKLQRRVESRPKYLTISESEPRHSIAIRIRGDVHQPGTSVSRGFLSAIGPATEYAEKIPAIRSGRLQLAQWIADSRNPLTARVYANRIWCWLMGEGLSSTENNFGTTGRPPSHPQLLDQLAKELIRGDWSTKHLVRCIVHSKAYQRAVIDDPVCQEKDPGNVLLSVGNLKRLPVESLRDAMLWVSGELDPHRGGPTLRPGTRSDYDYRHDLNRRSVYLPVLRNSLPPLFEAFDFADASVSVGQRARSTVATQSLAMLNHPWVIQRSRQAATHWTQIMPARSDDDLITSLHVACYGRPPEAAELKTCKTFLESGVGTREERLADLIQSLFAAIDFRYLE